MNLIQKSKKIFSRLDTSKLRKSGIDREEVKTSSHSHHIVTYPPLAGVPEIKPEELRQNLSGKGLGDVDLYVHLPFCTGKCTYCSYVTFPAVPEGFVDSYLNALEM